MAQISEETNIPAGSLNFVLSGRWQWIDRDYAHVIHVFYERHEMTKGRNPRVAGQARIKGWFSPMDWVDITDPNERPFRTKTGAVRRVRKVTAA